MSEHRAVGMGHGLTHADSTAAGVVKICCVCGADLVGKERLKDHEGRYWCPPCAKEDDKKKQPAPCADCNHQFPRNDLIEFEKALLCRPCADKRYQAIKRNAARAKRAEIEYQEDLRRRHKWVMASVIAGIVVVAAFLLYYFVL